MPSAGLGYSFTLSLTLALGGGVWSTPRPNLIPPGMIRYSCVEGHVGPEAGLDGCGKSRFSPWFDPQTVQARGSVAAPTELFRHTMRACFTVTMNGTVCGLDYPGIEFRWM